MVEIPIHIYEIMFKEQASLYITGNTFTECDDSHEVSRFQENK